MDGSKVLSRFAPRRRDLLIGVGAVGVSSVLPCPGVIRARAADKPTLVISVRDLSNPAYVDWQKGAQAFAKSIGAELVVLVSDYNSDKCIADIKAMLSKTGGNCVVNVDPNDSPDARPIVEACMAAKAYLVTHWNKPADLHPWDNNPYYVSHIEFNGEQALKDTAEALFRTMGGKGGIVALGGLEANVAAIRFKKGLMLALADNPDIQLLDFQVANWSAKEAYEKMNAMLTRYGDDIKGVWAGNDTMGLAALEALRADGRAGKVLVTGVDASKLAVEAIMNGEMAASAAWQSRWQGGMGLSIAYHAKMGTFDPAKEPKLHREFYGTYTLVTADNAKDYYNNYVMGDTTMDWNDLWGRITGQITYS